MSVLKKILGIIILLFIIPLNLFADEKLAQTGMQFISVTPDARAAALGGAMTTIANKSGSVFSNPAMLAENMEQFDVMLSRNNWIADINHNAASLSYAPENGIYGVFNINLFLVDYGDVEGTIIAKNEQGFLETGVISPTAYAIGLGYARSLSDKFSIGGTIRYVNQNLGPAVTSIYPGPNDFNTVENELSVFSFDFGTLYKTGFKSLAFGMSINNFSREIQYVEESFQLPLTFNIGVSMNLAELLPEDYKSQHILLSIDANHPRSYPEQLKMGIEYTYLDIFSLRGGYITGADEQGFSFGFGVQYFGVNIDYAYTPFGIFDNVQRFTFRFSI